MPWRNWPGPAEPHAAHALALELGLEVIEAVRPHTPTQRIRLAVSLASTFLMVVPVLLGGLPAVLLLPIPVAWLLMPWIQSREWQATQTVFAADCIVMRRGERDREALTLPVRDVGRIDATQDILQSRSGSCTLHFMAIIDDPAGQTEPTAKLLAKIRDVETGVAQRIMAQYEDPRRPPALPP